MHMRYAALVFALLVSAGAAHASQPGNARRVAPERLPPSEVQGLFDAYTLVQAQDALSLNDDQYGSFVSRMKALQKTRRRLQQARTAIVRELARAVNGGRDSVLRERLAALRDHEVAAAAELRQAYEAVDEVLDLRQQARFRVFEERMEERKFELLMRARQRSMNRRRP